MLMMNLINKDKNKDFSMGNNKITSLRNPDDSNELVNKSYVDQKVSQAGGSVDLTPYTTKSYVDNQFSRCLRLDGSNTLTSDLDMNNQRIINLGNATHNQDAITLKQVNDAFSTISTENNKYTDQKIVESHISRHENRKNVLAYAMDEGEFTTDHGIISARLTQFSDSPHKTNDKVFKIRVERDGSNGLSEYKCRFNFNLFKLLRDNFSNNYTACLETYFRLSPFYSYEFDSSILSFEGLNMNVSGLTVKVNSEYKYLRTILNLSPDGTSKQIQRRLYVNFKSNFDNNSPPDLPIYVLIYGIKGESLNDIDMSIYDYEKAFEIANNEFQLHVPIMMNSNRIQGLLFPVNDTDAVNLSYLFNTNLGSYLWGETSRSSVVTECIFTIIGGYVAMPRNMYIVAITLITDKLYPLSSNHRLTIESKNTSVYNLNFSSKRSIDSRPSVGQQSADSRPTVGRQSADALADALVGSDS